MVKWAKFLKVSQSGYYTWKLKKPVRDAVDFKYRQKIQELFEEHRRAYGPERLCGLLRRNGFTASYRKVGRIMMEDGLFSTHCRRRMRSLTNSSKSRGDEFKNLVRGIEITEPFQVLSSDISYIRTGEGFEYLCETRDVASGVVLSTSMSGNMRADLVEDAIKSALKRWEIPRGSIFHSDRGSQYTSAQIMSLLARNGLRQSFSRVGKPGDNAWSESFFANLKKEAVHWVNFPTREKARLAIFDYVEGFYNTKRIQKRLGYLSPLKWLDNWYAEKNKSVA